MLILESGEEDDEDCDILMMMKSKSMLILCNANTYSIWCVSGVHRVSLALVLNCDANSYAVPSMLCALNSSVSMAGLNIQYVSHDIEY